MTTDIKDGLEIPMTTVGGIWMPPAMAQQTFDITGMSLNDGILTINGTGFGTKAQTKFVDYGSVAYEDGVENTFFSSYGNMEEIVRAVVEGSTAPYVSASSTDKMYVQKEGPELRYPGATVYYGDGGKSNFQQVRCWPRSGTPTTEPKLYLSWWFRQKNDTRWYSQFQLSDVQEGFNPQENDTFSVDAGPYWTGVETIYGRVIYFDPITNILHAVYVDQSNNNRLTGNTLTLDSGGFSAVLSQAVESRGSNKFIRAWESDGTEGTFRLSWTQTFTAANGELSYTIVSPGESQWSHMELEVDLSTRSVKSRVNNQLNGQLLLPENITGVLGHSPTVGLLGFDASVDLMQEIWLSDIYLDTTFKRVTLSNSSTFFGATHQEVLRPISWENNQLQLDLSLRALDTNEALYLYFYDEDGNILNFDGAEVMV